MLALLMTLAATAADPCVLPAGVDGVRRISVAVPYAVEGAHLRTMRGLLAEEIPAAGGGPLELAAKVPHGNLRVQFLPHPSYPGVTEIVFFPEGWHGDRPMWCAVQEVAMHLRDDGVRLALVPGPVTMFHSAAVSGSAVRPTSSADQYLPPIAHEHATVRLVQALQQLSMEPGPATPPRPRMTAPTPVKAATPAAPAVWGVAATKGYYCAGSAWYEVLTPGTKMDEREALRAGYRPAQGRSCTPGLWPARRTVAKAPAKKAPAKQAPAPTTTATPAPKAAPEVGPLLPSSPRTTTPAATPAPPASSTTGSTAPRKSTSTIPDDLIIKN